MALLDLFRLKKDSCQKFDKIPISNDLISLKTSIKNWLSGDNLIFVGESGTLYRFFQFAIWKYNLNKHIGVSGTLITRQITKDKNIINLSQEELLKLDNETSQWASAASLLGDNHRVVNPPNKLSLTYKVLDEWSDDWIPIKDNTIHLQALYFYNLMCGIKNEFTPIQSEDFCFAYVFDKITRDEGLSRWPTLQSHESNRTTEIVNNFELVKNHQRVYSKDHRIIQALSMWAKFNKIEVVFEYPQSVSKSWPLFWDFLKHF